MPFNINNFTAEVQKTGFAKVSDFEVEINGEILSRLSSVVYPYTTARTFNFRIDSTVLPQRSIIPIDYKDYGPPLKIGGLANYVEIDFTILCSPNLVEREFFMAWQDLVTGHHRKTGQTSQQRKNQFDIGYYNDYVSKSGISIYQLSPDGYRTYAVDLIDAYPLGISPISLSWSQPEIQRMTVTMTYRYFEERNESEIGYQELPEPEIFGMRPQINISLQQIRDLPRTIRRLPKTLARRAASTLHKSGIDIGF